MPGIPTHFRVLKLTIARLSSSGDPAQQAVAQVLKDNPVYGHLGAIGPILADFIPSDPPPDGPAGVGYGNWYTTLWKSVFDLVAGDGTEARPGLRAVLKGFREFLDKIEPIADDEDLDALKDMRDSGEIGAIVATAEALKALVTDMTKIPDGLVFQIGGVIGSGMKPGVDVAPGSPTLPPVAWTAREYLHWRHPGKFARALLDRAEASGDDRFRAYAYGYVTSYATLVAGSPHVNSSIGGTYRTDWWRHRWVNNYIDAWVYGFYEANAIMVGDDPTPPYSDWRNLCNAELQKRIELPGIDPVEIMRRLIPGQPFPANILPAAFGDYWFKAWKDAYGAPPLGTRFKADSLNGAYLMTWLVLWFQTSGDVFGCNPAPPMAPPADCGDATACSWCDPAAPAEGGTGSTPPEPEVESDPDVGKAITGALLALLGLATLGAGALLEGGLAIGFGVDMIIDGVTDINWAKLRCDLHWYRLYLYNALKALHEIMCLGGVQHPYAFELAQDDYTLTLVGEDFKFDAAKKVVRSRRLVEGFPAKPWDGALIPLTKLWIQRPDRGFENPQTAAYLTEAYPSFFVNDDALNPLASGDIKTGMPQSTAPDGGKLRRAGAPGVAQYPVQFGNAVANSVDLLIHKNFPDWNLDADRGLAYFTWQFKGGAYSDPVAIEPEP